MCVNGKRTCAVSSNTFKYHRPLSIQTSASTPPLTATVLAIKHHPNEEIVVLLDGSPAVVTLRNVKLCEMNSVNMDLTHLHSVVVFGKNIGIGDIVQGAKLLLLEPGTWNVQTAAFDNCRVMMLQPVCDSTNTTCTESKTLPVVALPARRKRTSMQ